MPMHNPMHPGEYINEVYLQPLGISGRALAGKLAIAPSTINRIIAGRGDFTPEMALRLAKCLGRTAESWLNMQQQHGLWKARQNVDLRNVRKLKLTTA